MSNQPEKKVSRVITNDAFVNASMLPFESIADYPSINGLENVILSNGKIVNVVSENYGFISNNDLFLGFEKILQAEHIQYEVTYKNVNDCQFTADYILDGEMIVGEKGQR